MKTALEWFRTLPEPMRTEAVRNTRTYKLVNVYTKAHLAIMGSFNWDSTPEGDEYWDSIYEELKRQKSYTKYLKQKV